MGSFKGWINTYLLHRFYDIPKYEDVIDDLINEEEDSAEDTIPTIVPNFDHSPRSGIYGLIYHDSTPQLFEKHVNKALNVIKNKNNQLLYLNLGMNGEKGIIWSRICDLRKDILRR